MRNNFKKFDIDTNGRTSGKMKCYCPKCRSTRKNKRDKSVSVNLDTGLFNCHYCGFKGCAKEPHPVPLQRRGGYLRVDAAQNSLSLGEGWGEAAISGPHRQWFNEIRHIPTDVLISMGITSTEEYMPQTGKKESCICFNYFEKGALVNTKFRTLQKQFKLISGARMIPYNIDGIEHTPECIITEGEIDALSFAACGRTDVISVPGGANRNLTWMDPFIESHFDNKSVIYIAVDTDTKGLELKRELMRRLGASRCRVVQFAEGCKDANEHLVKHGVESLKKALEDAPETPLEGIFRAKNVEKDLRVIFENGLSKGADTGLTNFDRLCTFEPGRLCIVTGIPGCGKSEFVDELALRLCLRHEWKAAFFSPENLPLEYHVTKLAEKLCGCFFKRKSVSDMLYNRVLEWLNDNVFFILPKENFTVDNILSHARDLVQRYGIRTFWFDPYSCLEHQVPYGQSETQYISGFLDKLTNFARRHTCLVGLVAHPSKMKREPGQVRARVPNLYDINGSAAFFNKCDFGLVVERDREANVTRIHVEKVKFRHLGSLGVASFVYNMSGGRYTPCEEEALTGGGTKVTNVNFDQKLWIKEDDNWQLSLRCT